jgi:hypothetical protein
MSKEFLTSLEANTIEASLAQAVENKAETRRETTLWSLKTAMHIATAVAIMSRLTAM